MSPPEAPQIRPAAWKRDGDAIRAVRHGVFTVEQGISANLDFDGRDPDCTHVLAVDASGEAIGTARMLPDGHVGRIAVHREWRGKGVGTRLVECLTDIARDRGFAEIYLHSQAQAAEFYTRLGYETRGEPFMEAGIEHVLMVRAL